MMKRQRNQNYRLLRRVVLPRLLIELPHGYQIHYSDVKLIKIMGESIWITFWD